MFSQQHYTYSSITAAADYVDKIKGFFDGFCFNFSGFDSLRAKGVLSKQYIQEAKAGSVAKMEFLYGKNYTNGVEVVKYSHIYENILEKSLVRLGFNKFP